LYSTYIGSFDKCVCGDLVIHLRNRELYEIAGKIKNHEKRKKRRSDEGMMNGKSEKQVLNSIPQEVQLIRQPDYRVLKMDYYTSMSTTFSILLTNSLICNISVYQL